MQATNGRTDPTLLRAALTRPRDPKKMCTLLTRSAHARPYAPLEAPQEVHAREQNSGRPARQARIGKKIGLGLVGLAAAAAAFCWWAQVSSPSSPPAAATQRGDLERRKTCRGGEEGKQRRENGPCGGCL